MSQKTTVPAIGLDLDGTIDQAPEFFSHLSACWQGDVHIKCRRIIFSMTHLEVGGFWKKLNNC
jgi:hypothetical protein